MVGRSANLQPNCCLKRWRWPTTWDSRMRPTPIGVVLGTTTLFARSSPVSKITFFNKTVTDRIRATKPKPQLEPSTPAQQEQFFDMLMTNCPEKPVVLSTYKKYAIMFRSAAVIKERQKLPTDMRTLCQPCAAAMNSWDIGHEIGRNYVESENQSGWNRLSPIPNSDPKTFFGLVQDVGWQNHQ